MTHKSWKLHDTSGITEWGHRESDTKNSPFLYTGQSVQLLSHVRLFETPWAAACQASLSITNALSLLKLMSSNRWCHLFISSSVIPFFPAFNLSQHQSLFQWVSSLHQVTKVLELQLKHQWSQWFIQSWFPLGLTSLISLLSKGFSRVFSSTAVWKH